MKIIDGDFKVEWSWIGEGLNGDYDPFDRKDKPILRFICFKKFGREWEEIHCSSFCTLVKQGTKPDKLKELSKPIFEALKRYETVDVGGGTPLYEASKELERELEKLSWVEA